VSDEDVSAWIVEDYFEDNFEETVCSRDTSWDVVKHYHPPREKRERRRGGVCRTWKADSFPRLHLAPHPVRRRHLFNARVIRGTTAVVVKL
jgi:hypothetical protein